MIAAPEFALNGILRARLMTGMPGNRADGNMRAAEHGSQEIAPGEGDQAGEADGVGDEAGRQQ